MPSERYRRLHGLPPKFMLKIKNPVPEVSFDLIGSIVAKNSRGTFKSGQKVNIVRGLATNLYSREPAYVFYDDNTVVDMRSVEIV